MKTLTRAYLRIAAMIAVATLLYVAWVHIERMIR